MSAFSDRLKELRKAQGLSQRQVGAAIEVNERSYRRYEAGDMDPSATIVSKLADLFEVSADYLLGRTNYWQDDDGHITVKTPPDIFSDEEKERIIKRLSKPR